MNKKLETLLERVSTWPEEAQADCLDISATSNRSTAASID
jgi:hypothetical protein